MWLIYGKDPRCLTVVFPQLQFKKLRWNPRKPESKSLSSILRRLAKVRGVVKFSICFSSLGGTEISIIKRVGMPWGRVILCIRRIFKESSSSCAQRSIPRM